ncbi:MAG: lipopolysaccharide heptosyltransferase II [Planctomycetaceae bacterium]
MKIAVFLPNWIGDVVMATPALRAIREKFEDAEIVGVMRPYVADVLTGTNLINRHLFHNPRGHNREQKGWNFAKTLRAEKFDMSILFPNSLRSAWWAWMSRAKTRVGFRRDRRGWLLTDLLFPKSKRHPHPVIDDYLRIAQYLGCRNLSRKMVLATLPEDEQALKKFRENHPAISTDRGYVCLNPGGAYGSAKHWPNESFAELALRVVDELKKDVLILCGPDEIDSARAITHIANRPNVVSFAEAPPSIGLTKAAIRHADLLVTTDSGPRHFAAAFQVPEITLFGPTHIAWSNTFFDKAVHLQLDMECGPCQQRICPLKHHRCMRDLSVQQVFDTVTASLKKYSAPLKKAS